MIGFVSALIAAMLLVGCATEIATSPTISAMPRTGLVVSPRIVGSVYDGRAQKSQSDAEAQLRLI